MQDLNRRQKEALQIEQGRFDPNMKNNWNAEQMTEARLKRKR